ncbi:MAG: response regulator transcription factor [Cytophagales bacterium]
MKILIVEDELELSESICEYLNSNGILCECATGKYSAIDKIQLYQYDCVLLDLMLEDGNGLEVLKILKKDYKSEGVIIISAIETLESKIEGLTLGADDYLTKPFHLSELLVRIQALVRRKSFAGSNIVKFNEIEIDLLAKSLRVHDNRIDLTKTELQLIQYFIANKGRLLSKSSIAEHLSGDLADMLDNHYFVYAHVKNLKKKLNEAQCKDYIKTVYGLGYKWGNE